jgi:hypothetical protein
MQKDKQNMLNEINTLVILKMDQLKHFRHENEFYDIGNSLLFRKDTITKLYARVSQVSHR